MIDLKHTFNFLKPLKSNPCFAKKKKITADHKNLQSFPKENALKQRPVFYQISSYFADIILYKNIKIEDR